MKIEDDERYFDVTDPKYILFDYMNFNHFRDILMIERTFNAYNTFIPLTMSVDIENSNIFNTENDNSGSDSEVVYVYNFLSSDNILMQNSTFEHSYINMKLGRIDYVHQTKAKKIDINDEMVHFGIVDCIFSNYTTDSAIYIVDIIEILIHQRNLQLLWHHQLYHQALCVNV